MAVIDFCISPAYLFLIPTYGAMWLAGKYCRALQSVSIRHIAQQLMVLVMATSAAFVVFNDYCQTISANRFGRSIRQISALITWLI